MFFTQILIAYEILGTLIKVQNFMTDNIKNLWFEKGIVKSNGQLNGGLLLTSEDQRYAGTDGISFIMHTAEIVILKKYMYVI